MILDVQIAFPIDFSKLGVKIFTSTNILNLVLVLCMHNVSQKRPQWPFWQQPATMPLNGKDPAHSEPHFV